MSATIRDATLADLAALVAIDSAAAPFPWSSGQFADSLVSHRVLVLEEDGEAVGFLIYNRVLDEAELFNVAVDPSRQGRGHGAALVARLIELNRCHASRIFLEVRASNERAIDLYQRMGFIRQGTRKGYYPALQGPALPGSGQPGSELTDAAARQSREDAWVMAYAY